MDIVEVKKGKADLCRRVLDALPGWFGIDEANRQYVQASRVMPMLGSRVDGGFVGFLSLKAHSPFATEILVMGVMPEWQRKGVGTLLVRRAERFVSDSGGRFLTVKTLAASSPDPNYAQTRKFYRAVGFLPVEEFSNLWGPSNPCLLLIKDIAGDDSARTR